MTVSLATPRRPKGQTSHFTKVSRFDSLNVWVKFRFNNPIGGFPCCRIPKLKDRLPYFKLTSNAQNE